MFRFQSSPQIIRIKYKFILSAKVEEKMNYSILTVLMQLIIACNGLSSSDLCKKTDNGGGKYGYECGSNNGTINKAKCVQYENLSIRFRSFDGSGKFHLKKYNQFESKIKKCSYSGPTFSLAKLIQSNGVCVRNDKFTNLKSLKFFLTRNFFKKVCTCSGLHPIWCSGFKFCFKETSHCDLIKKGSFTISDSELKNIKSC